MIEEIDYFIIYQDLDLQLLTFFNHIELIRALFLS